MIDKELHLQAVTIACQYSNNLPSVLLHAKLIVDFVQTGQVISDEAYSAKLALLSNADKQSK